MNRRTKNIAATMALALLSCIGSAANAGVINFTQCLTNCAVLDETFRQDFTSVATLEFTDNSLGGVDFVLTNTFEDLDPTQDRAFFPELFFGLTASASGSTNLSDNVSAITYDPGAFSVSGSLFDLKVDLARNSSDRLLTGQTASWTLLGITTQDLATDAILLTQRIRTDNGFGSSRILGQQVSANSVPEPGALALLMFGALGMIRSRRKAVAQ